MLNVDWANFVCLRPNRESYSELYRNNLVQREGWLVQVARGEPVLSAELCVQVSWHRTPCQQDGAWNGGEGSTASPEKKYPANSAEFLLEFCFRDKRGPEAIDVGSECQDCCSPAFSSFLKPRCEAGSDLQDVFCLFSRYIQQRCACCCCCRPLGFCFAPETREEQLSLSVSAWRILWKSVMHAGTRSIFDLISLIIAGGRGAANCLEATLAILCLPWLLQDAVAYSGSVSPSWSPPCSNGMCPIYVRLQHLWKM